MLEVNLVVNHNSHNNNIDIFLSHINIH